MSTMRALACSMRKVFTCSPSVVGVGDGMVAAQLYEAFVEGVNQDVVFVGGGLEGAVEVGLQLQGGAHAPKLEVAQPQRSEGQHRLLAGLVACVCQLVSQ